MDLNAAHYEKACYISTKVRRRKAHLFSGINLTWQLLLQPTAFKAGMKG
ncbi:MAG: hypothetical protein FWH22_11890 [Fibromonadales bacterium]|nr:hypothetical protein [Fibromonadales bacterium]